MKPLALPIRPALGLLLVVAASCTSGAEQTQGPTGTGEPTAPPPPNPPRSTSAYLSQDGKPILFGGPGGPEDLLYHGERLPDGTRSGGDQDSIIARLATAGGDALYIEAVKSHGGDGIFANGAYPACPPRSACYRFANPFSDGSPTNPADQRILDQWYGWLSRADSAGITIQLFLYDDATCPWFGPATKDRIGNRNACQAQTALIPEEDERLITPVVTRFKGLKHLVWMVAEEFSEAITPARASAIAARIRELDPDHPIGVHQLAGTPFALAGDPNIGVFDLQLGPEVNSPALVHGSVLQADQEAAGRYAVVLAESPWQKELVSTGDRNQLRQSNWAAVMGGAAGVMVYGMWEPIPPTDDMLGDLRRLKSFFESTDWTGMSDADSSASGATTFARSDSTGHFILYSAECLPGATLGLADVPAEADDSLYWYDPIDGSRSSEVQHVTAGANSFTAPEHVAGECAVWGH
jgi:hypothetical protein